MRLEKKTATGMDDMLQSYIRAMGLSSGLNRRRIYAAWDSATNAGEYTIRHSYRDGKLYITLNSSVVRSILYMQRDILTKKINAILEQDEMFSKNDKLVGYVKEIVLK